MKKSLLLGASFLLLLGSCSGQNNSDKDVWKISFESNGGSAVAAIEVNDGETASKPTNPVRNGYIFQTWCVDSYLTTSFDWSSKITSDWTLYASWKKDESSSSSSSSSKESSSQTSSEESSSEETINKGHGPEGSTLASWYLVGSGSLWDTSTGWTVEGGVQLYTNPNSETDKGCILGIPFKVGDIFKVTNGGDIWFGYEKVDKADSESNMGLTNFEGANDGYGGQNFKCIVEGTYDMYVNGSGVFWIQNAA